MQITKRISGILMALIMVINLLTGYTAPVDASEVKQNTKEVPYRNVMYYGEWSIYAGQKNFTPD